MGLVQVLSVERLRHWLLYEPETGLFRWRISPNPKRPGMAGAIAGTPHAFGYTQISVDGALYLAHRLAWLYVHGRWPENQIDHENGIKNDNRIANLREATNQQNNINVPWKGSASGYKGVHRTRNGLRFTARLHVDGKNLYLGTFDTEGEASDAYFARAVELFGPFARR